MASLSAAKPCVKKSLLARKATVPDPVAGIRDAEPFSSPSPAPAQPCRGCWPGRVSWDGGAAVSVLFPRPMLRKIGY